MVKTSALVCTVAPFAKSRRDRHKREQSKTVAVARLGQQGTVHDRDLIDWAYFREGVLQGGATMRVLLGRMPAAEARAMRNRFGW